jgi:phage major head subunit gpT-like protein
MRRFLDDVLLATCLATLAWLLAAATGEADDSMVYGVPMMAMLVNRATLTAIFTNLKTTFNKAFDAAPSDWQMTTMLVPSGSSQNDYKWLGRFPRMRKWLGDKVVKALASFSYTIVNDDYEATVAVDRNDIEDDNLGLYSTMAQDAGHSSKQLPDEIDADLKNGVFTSLCYDKQYFYDTDHPVGDGKGGTVSVSNKLTKALSAATLADVEASYGVARHGIMNFTDDEGRKLGLVPDILEVPPALEGVAGIICEANKLQDGSPNPYKGTAKVKVNTRLTSATMWMLHVGNRPVKPFIYQERKKPVFVSQTSLEADDVFSRKTYKFGAEARAAGGYGLWQLSYGSTGTT